MTEDQLLLKAEKMNGVEMYFFLKEHLKSNLKHGVDCFICGQFSKKYNRSVNSRMALKLISLYRDYPKNNKSEFPFIHVNDIDGGTGDGDFSKLSYWGLIETTNIAGERGVKKRTGLWRLTEKGERFVLGGISIPKHAVIYNGEFYGFKDNSNLVYIHQCIRNKFNYDELMID